MVPELHPPSPAKKFFTKMAKSFFSKKKAAKGKVAQQSSDTIEDEHLYIFVPSQMKLSNAFHLGILVLSSEI